MSDPNWFTSFDDLQIAYDDTGPGSAAGLPPVLLHHGFAANAYLNWVAPGVVNTLTASGRRVVLLDARGHGRSDKPHDPRYYGENNMARDVSTLIDTIGADTVDIVGYSMGAIVSLVVGTQEPRVRRLVIGGIGGGVVERGGVDTRRLDPEAISKAFLADEAPANPIVARFRAFAESTGADLKALAAQAASIRQEKISFERIIAPTLVLVGREDELGAHPEVLAAAIPGAELRLIDGDHLGAVADPQFAPTIVEFVNRP